MAAYIREAVMYLGSMKEPARPSVGYQSPEPEVTFTPASARMKELTNTTRSNPEMTEYAVGASK